MSEPGSRPFCARRGISLIEVLVMLSIIALVAALLLPALARSRESARRLQCENNLRQIGLAMNAYQDAHNVFPSGYISATQTADPASPEIGPGWGFGSLILSELEQKALFNATNFDLPITHAAAVTVRTTHVNTYLCPSSINAGKDGPVVLSDAAGIRLISDLSPGNYVGSAGQTTPGETPGENNGVFYRNSHVEPRQITDGLSQTFLVGERSRNLADASWVGVIPTAQVCTNPAWPVRVCDAACVLTLGHTGPATEVYPPNSASAGPDDFWSLHRGVCNFLFCDGSVRGIQDSINPQVYSALSTRAGGETLDSKDF